MKKIWQLLTLIGCCALFIAGCGGDGGGSSPPVTSTGVFVDKPVQGIKYVFGNFSGLTAPGGVFTYPAGTKGTFRIGDIVLGQAMGAPTVTIVDLVKTANPSLTNAQAEAEATKIAQFTMTLDDTPSLQTMTVTKPVFNSYTGARFKSVNLLTTDQAGLQALCQEGKPGSTLVGPAVAFTQMSTSLANLPMIRHTGEYVSTSFGGTNVADLAIQPDGTLYGIVVNNEGEAFTLLGSVTDATTGALNITPYPLYPVSSSTPLPGVTVTATSNGSGTITGKTVDTSVSPSQTTNFSLIRDTSATNKYTGIYHGTYTGTNTGDWAFGIDHFGRLIGFSKQSGSTAIALSGNVNMTTGQITLGAVSGGGSFTGNIAADGSVTGTWKSGATDSGTFSGVRYPINPAGTSLAITTTSLPAVTINTVYNQTLAATGGTTPYTWSVSFGTLPAGLTLNASTGVISGTPTAAGTSSFTVMVIDAASGIDTQSLSIKVNPVATPLAITTTSLPAVTVNTAYNQTLAATGGTTPYTWSISVGTLPVGLTLNTSTGTITGTPTAAGTSNFTVTVTDAASGTATQNLSITVNPVATPLTITTTTLPNATFGVAYSQTLAATGGTTPYAWSISVGSLPTILALNASTGAISGKPTVSGTVNFTAMVTDGVSGTDTQTLSLTIDISASISASKTIYDANCAGCHQLGVYDTTGGSPNLSGVTLAALNTQFGGGINHNGSTLNATQITDMFAFLSLF